MNYKTAKDFGSICQRFEMSLRNDILTFNHHKVIAALPQAERLPLLQQAVEKHWSTSVLKKQAFPEQEKEMPTNTVGSFATYAQTNGLLRVGAGGSESAKQYGGICRAYEMCIRIHNCTFKHHQVIAAPPTTS